MSILKTKKKREVPFKNYIYLALIILGSFLVVFYVYRWYDTYQESKLNVSIMNDYLQVINYNEIDNYIVENKNAIIYVSVLGDEEINRFEKKFKNVVVDNDLRDSMLYLNVTSDTKEEVSQKMGIADEFPYIVVYTNGKITDTYSIKSQKYNMGKIMKYLNRIGATEFD